MRPTLFVRPSFKTADILRVKENEPSEKGFEGGRQGSESEASEAKMEDVAARCEERVTELTKEIESIHATQREIEELMSRRRQGGSSSEESKSGCALSIRFDETRNEVIEIRAIGYGRKVGARKAQTKEPKSGHSADDQGMSEGLAGFPQDPREQLGSRRKALH